MEYKKREFERKPLPDLILENAQLLFTNFSGKEKTYNKEGDKNYNVIIDPEMAQQLKKDGWNIKEYYPRNGEEGEVIYHLQVKIEFEPRTEYFKPSTVVVIRKTGDAEVKKKMSKFTVNQLDWMTIKYVHTVIHASQWDENKYKAYCQTLYAYVEGNPIEEKYGYVDDDDSAEEEYPFD